MNLLEEDKEAIIQKLKDKNIIKNRIPLLKFESMKELKEFNKSKSLVLFNKELINLINNKEEKDNQIEYLSNEKQIELIINNEKCFSLKSYNKIHSNINSNLFLLIKIIFKRKDIFKNKKSIHLNIPKKGVLEEYKRIFNYDNLQRIIKESNLTGKDIENEINIFNYIENIQPNFINSIKEKILKLNTINFKETNNFFEIKAAENITFEYLKEFENIIFDGNLAINFCKLNIIKKDLFILIKTFFIKEKILIIFINDQDTNFVDCNSHNLIDLLDYYT